MRQDRQTTDPVGQDVVQHHHQRRVPVRVRDVGDEQRAPQRLRSGQRPGKGVRGERQCGVPVAGTGAPHLGEVGIDVEVGVVEPVGTPESEGRLDQALPQASNPDEAFGEHGHQCRGVRQVLTGEEDRSTDIHGYPSHVRDEFDQVSGTDAVDAVRGRHPSRMTDARCPSIAYGRVGEQCEHGWFRVGGRAETTGDAASAPP